MSHGWHLVAEQWRQRARWSGLHQQPLLSALPRTLRTGLEKRVHVKKSTEVYRSIERLTERIFIL